MRLFRLKIRFHAAICAFLLGGLTAQAHAAGWQYEKSEDKMSGASGYAATLVSDNNVHLAFPYDGDTYAQLVVHKHPRKAVEALIVTSNGQLLCHTNDCVAQVRFDDAPPVRFSGVGPADHGSKMLFFDNEARFIAGAKKAKRILVQLLFYQSGQQVFEFTTAEPLVWAPPVAVEKKKR